MIDSQNDQEIYMGYVAEQGRFSCFKPGMLPLAMTIRCPETNGTREHSGVIILEDTSVNYHNCIMAHTMTVFNSSSPIESKEFVSFVVGRGYFCYKVRLLENFPFLVDCPQSGKD